MNRTSVFRCLNRTQNKTERNATRPLVSLAQHPVPAITYVLFPVDVNIFLFKSLCRFWETHECSVYDHGQCVWRGLGVWLCWRTHLPMGGDALRACSFLFCPIVPCSPPLCFVFVVEDVRSGSQFPAPATVPCSLLSCFLVRMDSEFSRTIIQNKLFLHCLRWRHLITATEKKLKQCYWKGFRLLLNLYLVTEQVTGHILGPLMSGHQ